MADDTAPEPNINEMLLGLSMALDEQLNGATGPGEPVRYCFVTIIAEVPPVDSDFASVEVFDDMPMGASSNLHPSLLSSLLLEYAKRAMLNGIEEIHLAAAGPPVRTH